MRDSWPGVYTGTVSPWEDASPTNLDIVLPDFLTITRNGFLNLISIMGNVLLQRKTDNFDAEMLYTVMPFKPKQLVLNPFLIVLLDFFVVTLLISSIPFMLLFTYTILKAKEVGLKHRVQLLGVSESTYLLSWLLTFTIINCIMTTLYTVLMYFILFSICSFIFLWLMTFLIF